MSSKNVLIPLEFLMKITDLLVHWDTTAYDYSIRCDYDEVMDVIIRKLQSLQLRNAYSKIIHAKDEEKRDNARLEYLKRRYEKRR